MRKSTLTAIITSVSAGAAAAYLATLYKMQNRLMFKPNKTFKHGQHTIPQELKSIEIESANLTLPGLYYPGNGTNKPAILYNHGQSYNIEILSFAMKPYIEAGYPVLMAGYRYYNPNIKDFNEEDLILDLKFYNDFLNQNGHEKIVLHGHSMGCAFTASLATKLSVPPHAVVLEAPFSSLAAAAKFPLARQVLKFKMNTLEYAKKIESPLLVMHGTADKKIPIEQGRAVFDASPSTRKDFMEIPGGSHYLYNFNSAARVIDWLNSRRL